MFAATTRRPGLHSSYGFLRWISIARSRVSVTSTRSRGRSPTIIDQSSRRFRRCVAVYLPILLPTAVPTSVLLRQCIPPHTRALPSSAWISRTLE
jgi:hypothetical protein